MRGRREFIESIVAQESRLLARLRNPYLRTVTRLLGPLHCARAALFSWLVRGSRTSLSFSFLLQTIRLLAQATSIPQARLRAVSPISAIALQRGAAVWAAGLVSRLGLGCYYERRTLFFSIFLDKTDSCGNDGYEAALQSCISGKRPSRESPWVALQATLLTSGSISTDDPTFLRPSTTVAQKLACC